MGKIKKIKLPGFTTVRPVISLGRRLMVYENKINEIIDYISEKGKKKDKYKPDKFMEEYIEEQEKLSEKGKK